MAEVPLRRNRDFLLLQAGQLLSATGSQSALVAYPLLVLAATGSPALAGLVAFVRTLATVGFSVLGGVAVDRVDRRVLMVVSDAVRAVAIGALAVGVVLDRIAFWQILLVAFVEGTFGTLFTPASIAALRSVVPAGQLPAAVATQEARTAAASLAGPPLGGALFGLGRALPFLADMVSYAFSMLSVMLLRAPLQPTGAAGRRRVRADLAEGWRFLWGNPFLRTTTFLFGLTNVLGPGVFLAVVVLGDRQGLSSGTIGALLAMFSASALVGSFASGLARRALSVRTVLLLELWAWPALSAFLVWPDVYVLVASMLCVTLAVPITNSVVHGYRLAITPDRLVGRVDSVRTAVSLALAPFGSLAAGLLLSAVSARVTMLSFVAVALLLAGWGTLSPALRNAPNLSEIGAPGGVRVGSPAVTATPLSNQPTSNPTTAP
ncbi:MAG TPA: MFS transporter [Mycobacteriales bacterium]